MGKNFLFVGIAYAIGFFSGPIASCLAEKYGYRAVVVSGSFLAAAAFLAGSWAPNLDLLILLYSAIGGMLTKGDCERISSLCSAKIL